MRLRDLADAPTVALDDGQANRIRGVDNPADTVVPRRPELASQSADTEAFESPQYLDLELRLWKGFVVDEVAEDPTEPSDSADSSTLTCCPARKKLVGTGNSSGQLRLDEVTQPPFQERAARSQIVRAGDVMRWPSIVITSTSGRCRVS